MSLSKIPFTIASNDDIYKKIGIESEKIENSLKLVKEWLKCESYLPNDVDDILLKNFIIGSKGNVERTKEKLEKYIIAKTKMTSLYSDRVIKDEEFSLYPLQRFMYISPNQTPEGNRIVIFRIPEKDPTHFVHFHLAKYICLIIDVLLFHDNCTGYHFIYDVAGFTPQYLAKFNLTLLKQVSELLYNTFPVRIKSLQLLNENTAIQVIMNVGKTFMSQKLKDRISSVKMEDLSKCYPKNCLPNEYGGAQGHINDGSDQLLQILKESENWCVKSEEPKLIGPIPEDKNKLYSFDDFAMDGSFRKLNVD